MYRSAREVSIGEWDLQEVYQMPITGCLVMALKEDMIKMLRMSNRI